MLASLLLSLGGPLISKLIGTAATAVGGPLVGTLATTVLGGLASGLGAPSAAEPDLVKAIQSDIGKATDVVKNLEAAHGPSIEQLLADSNQVNLEQAKSASLFVAGARPAALWLALALFGYEGLVVPVLGWVFGFAGLQGPGHLPSEVWNSDIQVIFGLAGIRAIETMGGVARESLATPRAAATNIVAKVVAKVAGR